MNAGERQTLIAFYRATGGDSWAVKDGWCTSAPLWKWLGVVTNAQGSVVRLELRYNNLVGAIFPAIGRFKNLQHLDLGGNELSGTIPAEIGELTNLQELLLYGNNLNGHIPKELGLLTKMQKLSLRNNKLTGAIPAELGGLKNLQRLYLFSNQLSGAIPKEFGKLKDLLKIDLSNNQLSAIGGVDEAQWLLSKFKGRSYDSWDFDLRGNPWIMPPEAVVEDGFAAVKTFYMDVQRAIEAGATAISRRLLKVVLVGSPSAGKTSLMESIISRQANRTEGRLDGASTEGIDVRHHTLENISVEFYDCAGQVDYGGMHQVFLSRRALFLLVWDITRCSGLSVSDLDKVIRDIIMRWLYTLHLRAPGATVLLVANKCDRAVNDAVETAQRVEKRVRIMLQEWKDRRNFGRKSSSYGNSRRDFDYRPEKNSTEVNLLDGSSRTSCDKYSGIPALIERVLEQCTFSIEVPPAWDLGLEFINALRCKRSPIGAALEERFSAGWSGSFITKEELSRMWRGVVGKAKNEMLRTNKSGVSRLWQGFINRVSNGASGMSNEAALYNSDSALEGALRISEFAGNILLVEDGEGIFPDVVWLSELLTPILSHKLKDQPFPTAALCAMRDDLVEDKILRWEFAQYLWRNVLSHSSLHSGERVAPALFSVLIKLGVVLPLGTTRYATNEESALRRSQRIHESSIHPPDMLVLMRLHETLLENQHKLLDECTIDALRGACEVTLEWKFDAAGSPYGLIEKLIASCHVIGVAERDLCWRYGALFRSRDMTKHFGRNRRLFTLVVRYDTICGTSDGDSANVLTVRMIGHLEDLRLWAALRFVASAVIMLSKEWPGAILKGSPVCPKHPRVFTLVYLATPSEARIGGPLIPEATRGVRSNGCDCHLEYGEVLGRVVNQLGAVVDINKDPFEGLLHTKSARCNIIREMFILCRPYTWPAAMSLWGLALVLFGGITTGIVEEKHALWQVCLAVMILSLVGAVVASVVVYRDMRSRAAQHGVRQSPSPRAHDIWGDVEAVPLMTASS